VDTLKDFGANQDDIQKLQISIKHLEEMFLLVVVGEFNSGKSSFINALLGKKYLEDGVTPTTSHIDILKYGDKFNVENVKDESGKLTDMRNISIPVDWLKKIKIVDTPGTNAVFRVHQALTEHFVPRSDLVLWITSVDRAFTESERLFLKQLDAVKKEVIIIMSKKDILENDEEVDKVLEFVLEQYKKLRGSSPHVFPISSKLASVAKKRSRNNKYRQFFKKEAPRTTSKI